MLTSAINILAQELTCGIQGTGFLVVQYLFLGKMVGGGAAGIRMVIFQMNTEMDCWIYSL